MSFLGLTLKPVVLDLFYTCDLFGVVKTFEVVVFGSSAIGRLVGLNVALLEFLPEGETARSTAFEAEPRLSESKSEVDSRVSDRAFESQHRCKKGASEGWYQHAFFSQTVETVDLVATYSHCVLLDSDSWYGACFSGE